MREKYDVIVVGGGLGGLTAAALMSVRGKSVLLVEKEKNLGGCAVVFKRKNFFIETGLHAIDGFSRNDRKMKIMKELGIDVESDLNLVPLPEFYKYSRCKREIVIPADYKKATEILSKEFPKERKGIKRFFRRIILINEFVNLLSSKWWEIIPSIPGLIVRIIPVLRSLNLSVGDFIDGIIDNEELKLILLANLIYYHDDPYSASLLFFGAAQGSYFAGGAWFFKGGSKMLVSSLEKVILDNDGEIINGSMVEKILVENGRAVGVEILSEGRKISIPSDRVILNGALRNGTEMLPPEYKKSYEAAFRNFRDGISLTTIHIGLSKSTKEFCNDSYSTFVIDEEVTNLSDLSKNYRGDWKKRSFTFVDYSMLDSGLSSGGKAVCSVCFPDYISEWENLEECEYRARKKEIMNHFISRLDKKFPGIKDCIEYSEVATPKTIKRYTLNPSGSVYGFEQSPDQAMMHRYFIRSTVKRLYFASAWGFPGGGFSGAILSGEFAANMISQHL